MTHEKYNKNEVAIINKDRPHESKVIVVAQTNLRLFTVVKSESNPKDKWTTNTYNLTKIKKMIQIKVYIMGILVDTVAYFQEDYDNTKVGDVIKIGEEEFTVTKKEPDKLYLG